MDNIFFNTSYSTLPGMLIRIFVFLLVSGLLVYFIYLGLSKVLFVKSKHRKEINLRLVLLWSLFIYLMVFNVYMFILFYRNGNSLDFMSPGVVLGILAQLVIFICAAIFFFTRCQSLKKIVNDKSIN